MAKEVPIYICHKKVRALEIKAVGSYVYDPSGILLRTIVFRDEDQGPMMLPDKMFVRYVPDPGDFLVTYEDGYQSFSPRKAFLDGYAPATEDGVLMERLSNLADTPAGTPFDKIPEWLRGMNWASEISRLAREAYVTINSLKQRIERLEGALASLPGYSDDWGWMRENLDILKTVPGFPFPQHLEKRSKDEKTDDHQPE